MEQRRRQFLAAAVGGGVACTAGCLNTLSGDYRTTPTSTPVVGGTNPQGDQFFSHDVSLAWEYETLADAAVSGGVPQDGIPSIEDPQFASVADGDERMDPGDPVFGVQIAETARAYPQYILVRHEIVNDEIAGNEVAVTYCPLTGTALGFDRSGDEFGVSGMLVNNNLIMYDRGSNSWWPQVLGTLIRGDETEDVLGRSLDEIRVIWTTWGRWREQFPDTEVLTEDTGEAFSYVSDPYGSYNPRDGYYADETIRFPTLHEDGRYHPKEVFLGARTSDGAVAFRKDRLRNEHLLTAEVEDTEYLAAYHHGLDSAWIYRNPEELTVTAIGEEYEDPDGNRYRADALPLSPVNTIDAMWFAWIGFYPNSVVIG